MGRVERTHGRLRDVNAGVEHQSHIADLSSLDQTKQVDRMAAEEPRIDVLINNAGNISARRATTADGLDRTFAFDHVAYFVLTHQFSIWSWHWRRQPRIIP
jgi:NAD(P)-dependent dehydrogenase (short-subunit alcohol dehydrogenase family)